MAQEIDTEDVYARIAKGTGLSRAEIDKKRDATMASFPNGEGGSMLTSVGALLVLADKLAVKTTDPAPKAEPVLEAIMKDGAPELCTYCGSKKSWGVKVVTKNGKNAPGHITNDGKPLVTIVDGKTYTGDCPHWIQGAAKPSATKGTIFEAKAKPAEAPRQVMEPEKLAALLDKTFKEDMEQAVKVTPAEPMKVTPKVVDEDALLAELLASEPPTPTKVPASPPIVEATPKTVESVLEQSEIVQNARKANETLAKNSAELKAQPTTPNAAADTPTKVAADPSVRRDASATAGVDGTVVVMPQRTIVAPNVGVPTMPRPMNLQEDAGISLISVPQIEKALLCLPEYLAAIDLKGLLVRLIECTSAISTRLDGYRVVLEQSAVTNTAALAELEERVKALETKKPTKKKEEKE